MPAENAPPPDVHDSLRRELIECGRDFHHRGWSLGTSSNYSAVTGREPLTLLMTGSGFDKGRGIFYINPENGDPVFSIEIGEGDLINVPAGTKHWFDLCAERTIRAIRLFREKAGWTPLYTGDAIASGYQPLCFGPNYIAAKGFRIEQAANIAA